MKIPNYSNYEIYPQEGKVWSYKSNRFVGRKDKDGYWQCTLTADDGTVWTTKVHRLVWQCVNGAIPQGMQVNHIDEDKGNNSISNLNLMTCKENSNYGSRNERMSKAKSKQVGAFKNGELIMIFSSTKEAGRNGFHQSGISACCRNCFSREGNNSYKGFQWRYI